MGFEDTYRGTSNCTSCQRPNRDSFQDGAEENSMSNCTWPWSAVFCGDGRSRSRAKCPPRVFCTVPLLQVQHMCSRKTLWTSTLMPLGYSAGVFLFVGVSLSASRRFVWPRFVNFWMWRMASSAATPVFEVILTSPCWISAWALLYRGEPGCACAMASRSG